MLLYAMVLPENHWDEQKGPITNFGGHVSQKFRGDADACESLFIYEIRLFSLSIHGGVSRCTGVRARKQGINATFWTDEPGKPNNRMPVNRFFPSRCRSIVFAPPAWSTCTNTCSLATAACFYRPPAPTTPRTGLFRTLHGNVRRQDHNIISDEKSGGDSRVLSIPGGPEVLEYLTTMNDWGPSWAFFRHQINSVAEIVNSVLEPRQTYCSWTVYSG